MLKFESPITLLLQALADPARLAIVERLRAGPCSVGALAAPLPMTLAAVVQHVQVLERSGLVITEKTGRTRVCRLSLQGLAPLRRWLEADAPPQGQPAKVPSALPDVPDSLPPQPRRARHHPQFRKAALNRT